MRISYEDKSRLVDYMVRPDNWRFSDPTPVLDKWIQEIDSSTRFTKKTPDKNKNAPLYDGRFLCKLGFDHSDWKTIRPQLMNAVKLIFALEFGLEPSLAATALNFADDGGASSGASSLRDLRSRLMPSFNDVTEFNGHSIDTPHNHFTIEWENEGFTLSTSIDAREALMIQGEALHVIQNVHATARDEFDPLAAEPSATNILDRLKSARSLPVNGQDWAFAVNATLYPEDVARTTRIMLRDRLKMNPQDCVILSLSETENFVGVNRNAFESARNAENERVKTMGLRPIL